MTTVCSSISQEEIGSFYNLSEVEGLNFCAYDGVFLLQNICTYLALIISADS